MPPAPDHTSTALADTEAGDLRGVLVQSLAILASASPVIVVVVWSLLWAL